MTGFEIFFKKFLSSVGADFLFLCAVGNCRLHTSAEKKDAILVFYADLEYTFRKTS